MTCIIVDDEPLGRKAIQLLAKETPALSVLGCFGNAESAAEFLQNHATDLVFLDIRMPGISGLEFARSISRYTLVIFTTAYPEYAVDSYELDAIDYLLKPVEPARFRKAVAKAADYLLLLRDDAASGSVESVTREHIFVKADRRYFRILFGDILFVEGMKDYVIIHSGKQKIITKATLKAIQEQLPAALFVRTNKSYIVNVDRIDSFDNNDIFIGTHELAIGSTYREAFMARMGVKEN